MRWRSHQIGHWTCPTCHWTRPACHWIPVLKLFLGDLCFIGPVQHFILPVQHVIGPVQHVIGPPCQNYFWETCVSFYLSSMSLDLFSMSLDPRVKTILGRLLFHWTCPAFHLTPVSIVALGWNEKFSLGPEKSFGGKFEKFYFVHT
ncbi:hypothetical protein TNCV_4495351 [Trichonephila clavipes]|nr:hypothetical protein TNCV_4495351 [Trichonephila clavipes]